MIGRTALVTGATGYTGSRLVMELLRKGWRVDALIRAGTAHRLPEGCVAHEYDGSFDSVDRCFSSTNVDAIFHIASLTSGQHRPQETSDLVEANVLFPLHLIEAATQYRVRNFINTGSFWQHSLGTADYAPFSLYAATKQAFEDLAAWYVRTYEIRFVTLILYDIYGPGDPRPKILPLLLKAASTGQTLGMSPGFQKLNLVHINDIVSAYVAAAELPIPSGGTLERYVVRASNNFSLREVAAIVEDVSGHIIQVDWGARPYRPREIMDPWRGGIALPGWSPRIDLREGVRQLCADLGIILPDKE